MTEAPVADLMRLAKWAIRSWEHHSEYEDMLQESYVEAWLGYQDGLRLGAEKPLALAGKRAAWGPRAWLCRWEGRKDHSPHRYAARHVSWDAIHADLAEDTAQRVEPEVLRRLTAPSFEVELLDQLAREELVRRVFAKCTPRQGEVLYRLVWLQETAKEAAEALGLTPNTVRDYYYTVKQSCREWVRP